jgi:hypothetical protein
LPLSGPLGSADLVQRDPLSAKSKAEKRDLPPCDRSLEILSLDRPCEFSHSSRFAARVGGLLRPRRGQRPNQNENVFVMNHSWTGFTRTLAQVELSG